MHHFPAKGNARDVGELIVNELYPEPMNGRIPIVSVTGTNGKTTVTRLTSHLLIEAGRTVGTTTSDGIYLGKDRITQGDTTGPISARAVLCDPAVEVAVLETARGGIVKRGLGYDWSDVGVLTNVQLDHLGQDGIEDLSDIVRIKKLVAERVREGGVLVLNAGDGMLERLAQEEFSDGKRELVLFLRGAVTPFFEAHLRAGRRAYFLHEGKIFEAKNGEATPLLDAARIPFTFGGTALFQIENSMAALAAGRALGLSIEECVKGLETFQPTKNNTGRANVYELARGWLVVDYGHNPEAFRAVGEMTSRWLAPRVTGVIAVPGDRTDEMLRLGAQAAAASFDRLIVREDLDLRGRKHGEAAAILCEAVERAKKGMPCVTELDEEKALDLAVNEMEEGEVIAFFYDDLALMRKLLEKHGAKPLNDFGRVLAKSAGLKKAG